MLVRWKDTSRHCPDRLGCSLTLCSSAAFRSIRRCVPRRISASESRGAPARRLIRAVFAVWSYRQFWDGHKQEELLASLDNPELVSGYEAASPTPANRFNFRPQAANAD